MKIHNNSAAIIIENRAVLMVRSKGKSFFISPGGGIEEGETPVQAVCRELDEECAIKVTPENTEVYGVFEDEAKGRPGEKIRMTAFLVKSYMGNIQPSTEVEECTWVNSDNATALDIGSIFRNQIIPRLQDEGLVD